MKEIKIKESIYSLPLTLTELWQFKEDGKFVEIRKYHDHLTAWNAASYDHSPNSVNEGYCLSRPWLIDEFYILSKYFVKKKDGKKANLIIKIFNKYIQIEHIQNPEIIYEAFDECRDSYNNRCSFSYGKPKVENFGVHEIFDHRPQVIKDLMNDWMEIAKLDNKVKALTEEIEQKKEKVKQTKKAASEKMDCVDTKYKDIMNQVEKEM